MEEKRWDAVIIGGGVVGCAIARELSRYEMKICLVEKEEDVCSGTSKANSAIVHAGYDAEPGTMKARMNLEGNRRMEPLAEELDFDFRRNGSLVLCFAKEDLPALKALYERGRINGVPGLRILSGEEALAMEPNLSEQAVAALYAPTGGIVCPFGLTIALAENACVNGVEFRFLTRVDSVERTDYGYLLKTGTGEMETACVINAAGVYGDVIHNMVSSRKLHITPRKGDYWLLDKAAGAHVSHTVFQLPGKLGKGVLVTPTVHGNLLLGPTASDQEDRESADTTAEELEEVARKASLSVKQIPFRQVITSFSGLRAHEDGDDFILGEIPDAPGFFDAVGMESPGLSSAPAIGAYMARMVAEKTGAQLKKNFTAGRKGIVRPSAMSEEERADLIRKNPLYGTIVCRCEGISEGEIVDAVHRKPGAVSMDGIKRRVRAGMGRCQAGFCTPRTMEILARETGKTMEEICKNRPGSELIRGENRRQPE